MVEEDGKGEGGLKRRRKRRWWRRMEEKEEDGRGEGEGGGVEGGAGTQTRCSCFPVNSVIYLFIRPRLDLRSVSI